MEKLEKNVTQLNSWHEVDWTRVQANVKSLRERIFVASKENDLKRVSRLQKLMIRSRSNWLVSIRRVTQLNKGRWTPGVDKEVYSTPEERLELFRWLETIRINDWNPPAVRRVYIAKDNGRKRPLGIPTVKDRIIQAIVKTAFLPSRIG
jgi:RNA-directed DNA polymerase